MTEICIARFVRKTKAGPFVTDTQKEPISEILGYFCNKDLWNSFLEMELLSRGAL
jgi:hypothetical protein